MFEALGRLTKDEKETLLRVRDMTPMQRYFYWIKERERVRLSKELNKPKPWTDDPILRRFRFCNARRMDDRVSDWLYQNWYKPYYNHPNMLLAAVLARHFNQPTTLEYIGFPEKWQPKQMYMKLLRLKKEFPGRSVFNGAYMIRSSSGSSPVFYPDKCEMVIKETVQQFVDDPPELDTDSIENSVGIIGNYRNFGTFMSGQVVADLRWAIEGNWSDRNTWAAIGPGSRRGFNRIHERDLKYNLKQEQFNEELAEVMRLAKRKLPKTIWKRLEAIDYQNGGCETDKYNRIICGEGKPKQKYPGV